MNKQSYQELLKDPRWIKRRNEILTRDKNTCQFCGAQDKYLHVHHKRYTQGLKPWEYSPNDLITLCERCHENETEMNSLVYEEYKGIRDTFKKKGLSMTLLDTILSGILDVVTRQDEEGELASQSNAYKYIQDCIYGTQLISDIFAAKKCGIDVRKLVEINFPEMLSKYDSYYD